MYLTFPCMGLNTCPGWVLTTDEGEGSEWREYDLAVAQQLDEYWDRLQGLASVPQLGDDLRTCFPFSHVREVRAAAAAAAAAADCHSNEQILLVIRQRYRM